MMTADLTGTEVAEVGLFDLDGGDEFHPLGETTAWNWQMGCQLQWLEGKSELQVHLQSPFDSIRRSLSRLLLHN